MGGKWEICDCRNISIKVFDKFCNWWFNDLPVVRNTALCLDELEELPVIHTFHSNSLLLIFWHPVCWINTIQSQIWCKKIFLESRKTEMNQLTFIIILVKATVAGFLNVYCKFLYLVWTCQKMECVRKFEFSCSWSQLTCLLQIRD